MRLFWVFLPLSFLFVGCHHPVAGYYTLYQRGMIKMTHRMIGFSSKAESFITRMKRSRIYLYLKKDGTFTLETKIEGVQKQSIVIMGRWKRVRKKLYLLALYKEGGEVRERREYCDIYAKAIVCRKPNPKLPWILKKTVGF